MTSILHGLAQFSLATISWLGYGGIFFLMMCESMIIPMPSELVMPFAGYLVSRGDFSFFGVVIASTLGSIAGSLLSYAMGRYGGKAVVLQWGRYLLLDEHDLAWSEKWFSKRGDLTIFISRFVPVVRHLISIPAGIGRMPVGKFSVYTIMGAMIWNSFLMWLGYVLGENWNRIRQYSEYVSIAVAVFLILGCVIFLRRHIQHKHLEKKEGARS